MNAVLQLDESAHEHLFDALHAQRRVRPRPQAGERARARRGPVCVRHRGQSLLRCPVGAVLLADRLLLRRGAGCRGGRADGQAAVLDRVGNGAPRRGRARREAVRTGTSGARACVLHQRRRRVRRVRVEARSPVPRRHRRRESHQGDRAQGGLSRLHAGRAGADRRRRLQGAVRRARDPHPPRVTDEPVPAGRGPALRRNGRRRRGVLQGAARRDRGGRARGGPGHDLAVHRRARPERRRLLRAPGRLLAGAARAGRQVRLPDRRRRGHHRVRPARRVVRLDPRRRHARPDHHRQGDHLGVRPDGRGVRVRPGGGAVVRRSQAQLAARDHVRRPPAVRGDLAQEP